MLTEKKSGEWSSSPEVKAADWDLSSLAVDTKQQVLEKMVFENDKRVMIPFLAVFSNYQEFHGID